MNQTFQVHSNAVIITVPALLRVRRDKDGGDPPPPVRRPGLDLLVRRARRLRLRPRRGLGVGRTVGLGRDEKGQ